jgi:V8-like Glu-specific endopeptidase
MGRRIARFWGLALAVVLFTPVGAGAIIGGTDDGSGHPNVAFVIAVDHAGGLADACTGTLIDESAVVTAAHCLADGYRYFVSFNSVVDLSWSAAQNGFRPVERFERNDRYDVGVLELSQPENGVEPADLPAPGALSGSRKGDSFTHVGYGVDSVATRRQSASSAVTEFTRRTLTSPMSRLSTTHLYTHNREGSICHGDSGGPVFKGDVVVALGNSVANARCQGTNSGPRLDIAPVQSFLDPYLN